VIRLVEEQVLRHAARAVGTHHRGPERERGEDERADGREEDDERGGGDEPAQHLAVGEVAAERGDGRRVGGAEHVEEAPRRQQRQERGQREGVREERRGQAQRGHRGVVDAEVGEVLPETGGGLGQGVWAGESRAVGELGPGARAGERAAGAVEEAREEGADRRWVGVGGVRGGEGRGYGYGCGRRGGGWCGGGRDDGGGEERRRGRGHGEVAIGDLCVDLRREFGRMARIQMDPVRRGWQRSRHRHTDRSTGFTTLHVFSL